MSGPINAIQLGAAQILKFKGRATRSEFWWVALFAALACASAVVADILRVNALLTEGGIDALVAFGVFDLYTVTATLVSSVLLAALTVRRLHDAGYSGMWLSALLIPGVGGLLLLAICALPTEPKTTVHGSPRDADPYGQKQKRGKKGKKQAEDPYERAMRGYAYLFNSEVQVTPEMEAARKAEIDEYYRSRVLKPAASV